MARTIVPRPQQTLAPYLSRAFLLLALAIASLLASGCVNLKDVELFAVRAGSMASSSDALFDAVQESDAQIAGDSVDLTTDNEKSLRQELDDNVLKRTSLLRFREIVDGFGQYASALKELATLDTSSDIEAASKELAGALKSAGAQINDSILASAFTAVADIFVKVKQQQALRNAIKDAQIPVDTILAAVESEADRQLKITAAHELTGSRARAGTQIDRLANDFAHASFGDKGLRTAAARSLIIDQIALETHLQSQDAALRALKNAAATCRRAHRELGKDKIDTAILTDFGQALSKLYTALNAL